MNRITVEDIRAAMEKTGLKVVCRKYGDGVTCGCPQTILRKAAGGVGTTWEWAAELYGAYYAHCFRAAFDADVMPTLFSKEQKQGYADGLAAREALLKG